MSASCPVARSLSSRSRARSSLPRVRARAPVRIRPMAPAPVGTTAARVLLVGTYQGHAGAYSTIQSAVDAAKPGDWVLIAPGDYHERCRPHGRGRHRLEGDVTAGVRVTTPNLHIRGMDRNGVVIDGTKPGAPKCSAKPSDQDLGPLDANGRAQGRNGLEVWKASGTTLENLTVCNFLSGAHGGGNQIWWNGGDGSGEIGLHAYNGSYLSATSTYARRRTSTVRTASSSATATDPVSSTRRTRATWRTPATPSARVPTATPRSTTRTRSTPRSATRGRTRAATSSCRTVSSTTTNRRQPRTVRTTTMHRRRRTAAARRRARTDRHQVVLDLPEQQRARQQQRRRSRPRPRRPRAARRGHGRSPAAATTPCSNNRFKNNGSWAMLVVPFPDTDTPPPVAHCVGGEPNGVPAARASPALLLRLVGQRHRAQLVREQRRRSAIRPTATSPRSPPCTTRATAGTRTPTPTASPPRRPSCRRRTARAATRTRAHRSAAR